MHLLPTARTPKPEIRTPSREMIHVRKFECQPCRERGRRGVPGFRRVDGIVMCHACYHGKGESYWKNSPYARRRTARVADNHRYYAAHREELKQRNRERQRRNRPQASAAARGWRQRNAEAWRAYMRAWYAKNAEHAKASRRARYVAHRAHILARQRIWYAKNRATKLAVQAAWRNLHREQVNAEQRRNYHARRMRAQESRSGRVPNPEIRTPAVSRR